MRFFVFLNFSCAWSSAALCGAAAGFIHSADFHVASWNQQLTQVNNCSSLAQFIFASHSQVLEGLDKLGADFSEKVQTDSADIYNQAVNAVAGASSLLSAQTHGLTTLSLSKPECLTEEARLMTLVMTRHLKSLQESELRPVWFSYQGSPREMVDATKSFLAKAIQLFAADVNSLRSVLLPILNGEEQLNEPKTQSRMSIKEAMRKETFNEWNDDGLLLSELFSLGVLAKGQVIADLTAGFGHRALLLNESGLIEVSAFDSIPQIDLATNGKVSFLDLAMSWDCHTKYDWIIIGQVIGGTSSEMISNNLKKCALGVITIKADLKEVLSKFYDRDYTVSDKMTDVGVWRAKLSIDL